jgi:hypothetical protein
MFVLASLSVSIFSQAAHFQTYLDVRSLGFEIFSQHGQKLGSFDWKYH